MSIPTTDIFVTIVSPDRELLHDISWTLMLFGYQVTATCDFSEENPCRRNKKSGLLLIDTRSTDIVSEALALPRSAGFIYRIAIDATDATERLLLEGADDVIRLPINIGELLTRLRVGVRRLEFEYRLSRGIRRDPTTRLLTRQAFCKALDISRLSSTPQPMSCVTFSIDYYSQIREQYGAHAVRHLKATLARCIEQSAEREEICGILSDNVMVAVLNRPNHSAHKYAESVTIAFAASDTLVREIRSLPTLSATIAEWDINADASEQLDRCESTLEQVSCFGGNYIASAADVQQQIARWRAGMDAGVPFEEVVAQDLMEMFPIVLTRDQIEAGYESILPSTCMHLPCIPIVENDGTLSGIVNPEHLQFPLQASDSRPHTIAYHQPISDLFEAFNSTENDYLVVVDDQNYPLGYLHCEGLASLVLDKIKASSYRSTDDGDCSIASLIVPVLPVNQKVPQSDIAT